MPSFPFCQPAAPARTSRSRCTTRLLIYWLRTWNAINSPSGFVIHNSGIMLFLLSPLLALVSHCSHDAEANSGAMMAFIALMMLVLVSHIVGFKRTPRLTPWLSIDGIGSGLWQSSGSSTPREDACCSLRVVSFAHDRHDGPCGMKRGGWVQCGER